MQPQVPLGEEVVQGWFFLIACLGLVLTFSRIRTVRRPTIQPWNRRQRFQSFESKVASFFVRGPLRFLQLVWYGLDTFPFINPRLIHSLTDAPSRFEQT
jgi:hypothetical protein